MGGLRTLAAICMVLMALNVSGQYPDWAKGLCGEGLKEAVRVNCSPAVVKEGAGMWQSLMSVDRNSDGDVPDRFDGGAFTGIGDGAIGSTYVMVADKSWWMVDYGRLSMLCNDLHQLYPCKDHVIKEKKDYMPGMPMDTIIDNGAWQVGKDLYGQGVWSFPKGYEGEMARAMLYVACIYPADLFVGNGAVFMELGNYPSLSATALSYLLGLHNRYAPDEREKSRTEAISGVQGNVNPFVVYPELVDHIWGEYRDIPVGGCDGEDEPDLKPLKGYYTLEDKTVDLYSPFVPENAEWKLDGIKIDDRQVVVADLAAGDHELEYRSTVQRGKLIIRISK